MTEEFNGSTERRGFDRRKKDRRVTVRRQDLDTAKTWPTDDERRLCERRREDRRKFERRFVDLPSGLNLLDLPQQTFPGFRHFISAWYFVDTEGRRIVVDPGPASTIPLLLSRLSALTDDVDYVLLTHVHLDHSGGIAQFCDKYKNAKVFVHPRGRKHLTDPSKLWASAQRVLGPVAEMYGEPTPLDPSRLLTEAPSGIKTLETPGHAPHQMAFIVPFANETLFFVAEAAGLYIPMVSTPAAPYLRPTTPPRFDGDAASKSMTKIEETLNGNELLCYAHWGAARDPKRMVTLAQKQLKQWLTLIDSIKEQDTNTIIARLLKEDPLLSGYAHLPGDLQQREHLFLTNSVTGIIEYLNR